MLPVSKSHSLGYHPIIMIPSAPLPKVRIIKSVPILPAHGTKTVRYVTGY